MPLGTPATSRPVEVWALQWAFVAQILRQRVCLKAPGLNGLESRVHRPPPTPQQALPPPGSLADLANGPKQHDDPYEAGVCTI
jgi:hypothetical protein